MRRRSVFIPWLASILALIALAGAVTPYRPPDLTKEIFDRGKIELDRFARSGAVSALISVARDFDDGEGVDFELRAHALAIAARLDKEGKEDEAIGNTLLQLKEDGKTVGEDVAKSVVASRLLSAVERLRRKEDNPDNGTCAAYLADIGLRLDPKGKSARALREQRDALAEEGRVADWSGLLGTPIRRAPGPWEQGEERMAKKEVVMPGGKAEAFARPQTSVKGLMVRQLSNGNLAGSASTVNATALPERGQRDLLFTFNQEVGPMMGGCLEEVIKFLRVRYLRQPSKVPDGQRIEIGFQDKYVPKDGPSGATAFALLLDSLFSGEKIDDAFACTGDMTADGMVQKIGGAAAKIRGATAAKCKIVGIPAGNAPEIGDVLLLDGIDQLLGIQVFALKDFEEARAVSRAEKAPEILETLEKFNTITKVVKRDGEKILGNAKVQQRLQEVLDRMPNHLSAKLLLEKGKGTNPKVLTVRGTFDQIEIATSGQLRNIQRSIFQTEFEIDGNSIKFGDRIVKEATEALEGLDELEKAIDPRLKDYRNSLATLFRSIIDGSRDGEKPPAFGERLEREMDTIGSAYEKLMQDPSIVEAMN